MDETWLGVAEAGRRFRSRSLSPVELVRSLLDRIEKLDRHCHAFLLLTAGSALAEARNAETELAAGRDRGPLHGIPYALKDIVDVAGLPTTCNSKILRDNIATRDADVVERLRRGGAILLGKTGLHEFAAGGAMFDLPWPAARNPWDLTRHPGGSSSGSGSAVAAGFIPAALGTDTGGSVRHPATACGIVGMKPTYGLVSNEGVFPLAPSLDHVGTMTRGVEDNALLLNAIASRPREDYLSELRLGVKGLRIGVIEHFYTEDAIANAEYVRAIGEATVVLRELGARVEPVRLARLSEYTECGRVIQQFEQHAVHEDRLTRRSADYSDFSRAKLGAGAGITMDALEAARVRRQALSKAFLEVMRDFDAVITLSSLELPCSVNSREEVARTYMRHARMPFSLMGTPAMAVPTGFTPDGLPLGMQVAGAPFTEALLYRIAWAYCDATRWTERRPALAPASTG